MPYYEHYAPPQPYPTPRTSHRKNVFLKVIPVLDREQLARILGLCQLGELSPFELLNPAVELSLRPLLGP